MRTRGGQTHLPLSPSPEGGGGTQAAPTLLFFSSAEGRRGERRRDPPCSPSPPLGAERAGERWGRGRAPLPRARPCGGARFFPGACRARDLSGTRDLGPRCGARGAALGRRSRHDVREGTVMGRRQRRLGVGWPVESHLSHLIPANPASAINLLVGDALHGPPTPSNRHARTRSGHPRIFQGPAGLAEGDARNESGHDVGTPCKGGWPDTA